MALRTTLPHLLAYLSLGCTLGAALGCARDPAHLRWEADFYYTEKLYIDGQHQLASARFQVLRAQATDPRDADEAGLAACETLARGEAKTPAAACYDALSLDAADRQVRMRALLHAGELRLYDLGLEPDGLRIFEALVRRAPDTVAGLRAIDHLTLHAKRDPQRREAMVALFLRMERAAPDSDLADNLLLRAALLLEEDTQSAGWAQAVTLLERYEARHPEDTSYVDAMMAKARLQRKLGRFHDEARGLERVILTYESSYVFASYALDAHKQATERLIELYRSGPLRNLERAEAHARHLPQMLRKPLKILAYLVTIAEIQEERGNLRGAVTTYRDLLATWQRRHADMRENDERICGEEPAATRKTCLAQLDRHPPIETREIAHARAAIARLEARLAGAPGRGGPP